MEQTCIQIANEVLITTFARSHMDTSLRFVRGDPNVIDVAPSKAQQNFWKVRALVCLLCNAALALTYENLY
jgi:hypothetical protein